VEPFAEERRGQVRDGSWGLSFLVDYGCWIDALGGQGRRRLDDHKETVRFSLN
jgi:hypothetical protein